MVVQTHPKRKNMSNNTTPPNHRPLPTTASQPLNQHLAQFNAQWWQGKGKRFDLGEEE